ncbi:MAG: dCTP deaminase [Thermodesulfovibrionales bacterium]
MLKNDAWIRLMAQKGMIEPYDDSLRTKGVISWGVSSYGYDMRISNEFKIFRGKEGVLDPKDIQPGQFEDFRGDVCVVPPNSYVLAKSLEYFRIPRDVLAICLGKSTYARCGVIVNVTPLEPEWEGHVTIAISNTSPLPVRLYANEGLAQLVFLSAGEVCETSYADRAGKYQAQKGITLSRT